MANRILARISRLFSFAVERDWIEANPALRIGKPAEERAATECCLETSCASSGRRCIETEAKDADGSPAAAVAGTERCVHRDAADGATSRRGVPMRWQDVDLATGWWTIPASVQECRPPPRAADAPGPRVLQRRANRRRRSLRLLEPSAHLCVRASEEGGVHLCRRGLSFEFRAHDFRRTAASFMGEAGVDRFHIAHVLNHRSVTHCTVTAIYDRSATTRRSARRLSGGPRC